MPASSTSTSARDETLHFADGRLLLRGVNGSGKSAAINMLLPFLLEADTWKIDAAGEQTGVLRSYNEALRLRLDEAGDLATMRLWFEFGEPAPSREALELATAALLGIVRELLGRQWEPLSFCFTHAAPASLAAHRAVFGPRLRFGHDFTGLVSTPPLDAVNTAPDPLLRPSADHLRSVLGAPPAATVTGQMTQLVEMLLPVGRCSTGQVARSLGLTQRTLHRRLAVEGQSFSEIVHTTREALAERYLAADRYSLTEVSQLLGFTAPSAFSRWFRLRFGVSPTQWRAAARQPVTD